MIISYFFLFYEYFVLFLFARKRISPCGTFTAVFGPEQKAILSIRTLLKGPADWRIERNRRWRRERKSRLILH
ncbi:MAG: hypothetical protein BAA03_09615 [Caldibacillus debilis]|nr:MAG: hypothetical protein BAA03_09615 [Caldibacillus debilis]